MNRRRMFLETLCIGGVTAVLVATAAGQYARGRAAAGGASQEEVPLRIRRLEGVGRRGLVKTPEYQTNMTRSHKPPREWRRVLVEYETYPEWIDTLTFEYHVLAMQEEEGENRYSLYRTTVRYADIAEGRDHLSTVFLHPRAVERYGEVVAVAVQVNRDGTLVAEQAETDMDLPENWWKNPAVTESDKVQLRDGYLLDRSKTPFALINVDDYEVIR